MAESIFGLYKTKLVRNQGPWRGLDDLELATLECVDWFNHRRLFHELGRVPPASSTPTTTVTPTPSNRSTLKPTRRETRRGSRRVPVRSGGASLCFGLPTGLRTTKTPGQRKWLLTWGFCVVRPLGLEPRTY